MKGRHSFFSLILTISMLLVTSIVKVWAQDDTAVIKKDPVRFSIGYKQYFSWWIPVWKRFDTSRYSKINSMMTGGLFYSESFVLSPKPNFLFNPVIALEINSRWSLSGSLLIGNFYCKNSNAYQYNSVSSEIGSTRNSAKRIRKNDADLLVNYRVLKFMKIFIGPKYQGYNFNFLRKIGVDFFGTTFPYTIEEKIRFHSAGGGAGAAFTVNIVSNLYLLPNVSAIFLWGKNYQRGSGKYIDDLYKLTFIDRGDNIVKIAGLNSTIDLGYHVPKIGMIVSLGFRFQYLYYVDKLRGNYTRDYDLFYGPNLSVVFTF